MRVSGRPRHGVSGRRAVRFADGGGECRLRLYEETQMPLDEVRRRVEEVLGFVGLRELIDRMPVGAVRWTAAASRHCAGDGVQAADSALRRGDDRARSDHGNDGRRGDRQAARPRERQLHRGDAPAARRLLRRHARSRQGRRAEMRHRAGGCAEDRRGRVHHVDGKGLLAFEGNAQELRASRDPYFRTFLS